ncbi:hypothetical protein [Microbacterium sp. Marseille-Q6965]|uniref:hypothetical protein n=1 Tax=Microbacterium sp. Marseille-Q6965 TaxID=2965072 RepID=UPI0021B720DF|nr:hypothetical protein [Microbacterium sp. Marseille-Q6965]
MTLQLIPQADAAAEGLRRASWADGLGTAPATANDCGGGLKGLAGELTVFIRPLEDLLELVTGDPAGLYQASHTWETYAGDAQSVSELLFRALEQLQDAARGATADALRATLWVLGSAAHSIADWSKVTSQVLQLCVRAVEVMRSAVCAGMELVATAAGALGDLVFGSWPWEWEEKAQVIQEFAHNCAQVVDEVVEALDAALQALREMVRLATDLGRALVPFHQAIDDAIGALIEAIPPGEVLGPLGDGMGQLPQGRLGDTYEPGPVPFEGSEHRFREDHQLGYAHEFDLGETDMTTEQLNAMLRQEFGHVFLPSRVGDNGQLNAQLEGEGQVIETSLFGMGIPGVTSGDIVVQQMTDDGFVIAAQRGHPEYPGEVAFRLRNVDGRAVFEVTGAYDETILGRMGFEGNTNPAYAGISDVAIWSDMKYRLRDMMNYGR